ncbi:hypothetical protein GCM10009759_51820 [Kitasatospora saccharophila]|uniref:Uncharacterized protein n=1 Tax=Kitasatospora saccharophila TaxID=407973 RepID=A0ABN2XE79_9ACTN
MSFLGGGWRFGLVGVRVGSVRVVAGLAAPEFAGMGDVSGAAFPGPTAAWDWCPRCESSPAGCSDRAEVAFC